MTTDMKTIQDKILEVAIYVDELCRKHEITYYLMGGSALGAIRHGGFIPWDDDLDIFMTYDNYMKFLAVCEKFLDKDRFYFQKENTEEWPAFSTKIRMNNTTFIEEDTRNRQMHKGIYIDVICLNNASSNIVYRYIQYFSARLITARTLAIRGYITKSRVKKIAMFVTKRVINQVMLRWLLGIVRSLNNKETEYVGHFFGRARFKYTSFPKSYLGKPRYIEFSNAVLPVPEGVEGYLEMRYGNRYMEMPDEKTKAMYPSHAAFVDTENDYRIYEESYLSEDIYDKKN